MSLRRMIADSSNEKSLSAGYRKKRFELFKTLLYSLKRPVRILDVGGTPLFWQNMGFLDEPKLHITILNIDKLELQKGFNIKKRNIVTILGDARKMKRFNNGEFDIVFSNSVIEHVGSFSDQRKLAKEIVRVSDRFFLQTPNRNFPIEPHFLFPFFQFLPLFIKIWLLTHFSLGWYQKFASKVEAELTVKSIQLLTKSDLLQLFPKAKIYEEKVFGLTKSFIVYQGWSEKLS